MYCKKWNKNVCTVSICICIFNSLWVCDEIESFTILKWNFAFKYFRTNVKHLTWETIRCNVVNTDKRPKILLENSNNEKIMLRYNRSNFYVEKIFYKFFYRGLKVVIHSVCLNMQYNWLHISLKKIIYIIPLSEKFVHLAQISYST